LSELPEKRADAQADHKVGDDRVADSWIVVIERDRKNHVERPRRQGGREAEPGSASGTDETELRARRLGETSFGNTSGEPRETPPFDPGAHCRRHP